MAKDISTGSTIIGIGVFSLHSIWSDVAPKLKEVRDAPPQSVYIKQQILDATVLTFGAAALVGTAAYAMTNSVAPAILLFITASALAAYWYWVAEAENQL